MSTSAPRFQRVLLVDDNEIDNFINERIITSSGFSASVVTKTGADAAFEYVKDIGEDTNVLPQIIFLDLNMPEKDGFVFLEMFESLPQSVRSFCKVIVLSSSISPEDINKASANPHVIKYLNKPLAEKYLEAIII
ncbi:MAG: response regulator [Bacteroidetes bacterium]|nr:response regulator [Bacteroidota bacterium]HNR20626.1 response regulator [Bacteroidia bacterium]HNU33309.1 response regulator [Bacteroidia bacterium]